MSSTFRAVKEVWGESPDQFVGHDALVRILSEIAETAAEGNSAVNPPLEHTVDDYGQVTVLWVSDGRKFLEHLRGLNDDDFATYGFVDADEDGNSNSAVLLVQNLKALSGAWERDSLDPDGSLRFYID